MIKKYNDLQKDEVNVGQELKIPIKDKSTEARELVKYLL